MRPYLQGPQGAHPNLVCPSQLDRGGRGVQGHPPAPGPQATLVGPPHYPLSDLDHLGAQAPPGALAPPQIPGALGPPEGLASQEQQCLWVQGGQGALGGLGGPGPLGCLAPPGALAVLVAQPCPGAPGARPCPSGRSQGGRRGQAARGARASRCLVCLGSQEGRGAPEARASQGGQALLSDPSAAAVEAFLREREREKAQSGAWSVGTEDSSTPPPTSMESTGRRPRPALTEDGVSGGPVAILGVSGFPHPELS